MQINGSLQILFSFLWWLIAFYWITASGGTSTQDSSQLYWLAFIEYSFSVLNFQLFLFNCWLFSRLCVIFLGFELVFVVLCVAVACLIGIAVCFFLPCILGMLCALAQRVITLKIFKIYVF